MKRVLVPYSEIAGKAWINPALECMVAERKLEELNKKELVLRAQLDAIPAQRAMLEKIIAEYNDESN